MKHKVKENEVNELVERILQDTSTTKDQQINLLQAPAETRIKLLELLRVQDSPVLSTDGACGPG